MDVFMVARRRVRDKRQPRRNFDSLLRRTETPVVATSSAAVTPVEEMTQRSTSATRYGVTGVNLRFDKSRTSITVYAKESS